MKSILKKIIITLAITGTLIAGIVYATNVTVPSSPGAGYYLCGNTGGTYSATTTPCSGSSSISINGVSSTVFSLNSSTYLGITASGTVFTFSNLGVTSFNGATGTIIGVNSVNGATGTVSIATGTFSQWTTTSTGIFYNGGNVGIGTTSPVTTLQVNASNGYSPSLSADYGLFSIGGSNYSMLQFGTPNTTIGTWLQTKDSRNNGNAYPLSLNPLGGNVGIGTTSPVYALDMAAGDVYGYNGTVMAQASTTLFNYFLGGAGTIGAAATGTKNTGTGYQALSHLTTGSNNTANGYYSLSNNTTGGSNTANGYVSLYNNTTGNYNTANGYVSLYNNTTGSNNTANGYNSLSNNTTGGSNTANGYNSLSNNTTGNYNTANGYSSLINNTTNIATLGAITGGSGYTPGTYTGVQMTLSSGSSATTYPIATIIASSTGAITSVVITTNGLGFKDTTTFLTAPTSSLGGTGSGFKVAVASLSTGQYNTADGYQAGRFISGGAGLNETSTYSTYIGYNAYPLASGDTNETVIGNGAVGSGSNTVTLGGTGTTGTIIPYGSFGIGTTGPNTALDVNGDITDRNVTSSAYIGTNASGTIIRATTTKSIYDAAPSSTDDYAMFYTESAFTLKQVDCINDNIAGNTATFNITWGSNRNSTTSNAFTSATACTATTTIQTPTINGSTTIPAGSIIRLVLSAASSTGTYFDFKY